MQSREHVRSEGRESPLVLIVEDMLAQARLTRFCIEHAGYRAVTAHDGLQALSMVEAHRPDLILLDIDLPGMNGFQVLDRLRGNPATRHIPVIMVTAHAKDAGLFDQWATDRDAFVTKPYNPRDLTETVRAVLDRCGLQAPDEENRPVE